jgi:AcrR family transcriptional regulator
MPDVRRRRRDARENRERILDAALLALKRDGHKVPMTTVAEEAGVGVGTLYRHFPDREDLLAGLTERSYRLVLEHARVAVATPGTALDAIAIFFDVTINDREALILPMHGGPVTLDEESTWLRSEISQAIEMIVRRGKREGSIRRDVNSVDIIMCGAMLAQPLAHVPDWDLVARRQAQVFLAGLANFDAPRLQGPELTREQLEQRLSADHPA